MRLQFDRFRGFVEEFSANLSLGGMFIRTEEPREIGTEMPIEFRLGEDYELIRGRGRVVWVREEELDDEHPAGMGIRFLELTPGSRELIFKLVERRVREGGEPFDLEAEAEILDDLPQRPPDPGPAPETVLEMPGPEAEKVPTGEKEPAATPAVGRPAGEDEEFDPWEEALPALEEPAPVVVGGFETAPPPAPSPDPGGREPFYLGDLTAGAGDGAPGGPPDDGPGFRDESFTAGGSSSTPSVAASVGGARRVSPFGASDEVADGEAEGVTGPEGDAGAPPFADSPAGGASLGYTPVGGGAAYDNEEEQSFVRRRGLILGLIVVLVFGGLGVGWWLLGEPPEMKYRAEPPADGTAVAEERRDESPPTPVSAVDASDVEGGLGGVRATPPGQEPEPTPPAGETGRQGNADEGFRGTAAGDVPSRQPGLEGDSGDGRASDRAASSDGGQAGATDAPLRIESVSHQASGRRTVVVIRANRRLEPGDFSNVRIGGLSPRHVIRVRGVDQPLPAGQVTVGTEQVARVRSGLHLDRDPSELHLVLDFNSATARVTEVTPAGDTLRVVVEEGGG